MKRRGQTSDQIVMAQMAYNGAPASNAATSGSNATPLSPLEELMRRKGVDEAWNTLEEMQGQGQFIDRFTISRMLMKTVGDGRTRWNPTKVYRGIALVERFIQMQPEEADEVLFNALLDTCCRMKDVSRLESTVQRMRDLQIYPSHVTLGILVKAYGQANDLTRVMKVWEEMSEQRRQVNAVTYGCMIDACVKCGQVKTAIGIFHDMKKRKKHRNTILYTTLIKGYGIEKDLRNALALFKEMKEEGVPYNTITYNSIIDVCIRCSDVQTAEELLREMMAPGNNIEPDLITYSTVLKGYCHVGDLDKALQVAETIKGCGLKCDELVYNTLIDGCVKANDLSAGIGLFAEMTQSGMKPSSITHSILVRLYQRNGYKADAFDAVAQLYQHHGLDRPNTGMERNGKGGRRGDKQRNQPNAANSGGGGSGGGDTKDMGMQQLTHPTPQRPGQVPGSPYNSATPQAPGSPYNGIVPNHPPGMLGGPDSTLLPYTDGEVDPAFHLPGPYLPMEAGRGSLPCGMHNVPFGGNITPEPPPCGIPNSTSIPVGGTLDRLGRLYPMAPSRQMQSHNILTDGPPAPSGLANGVQWQYRPNMGPPMGGIVAGATPGAVPSMQAPVPRFRRPIVGARPGMTDQNLTLGFGTWPEQQSLPGSPQWSSLDGPYPPPMTQKRQPEAVFVERFPNNPLVSVQCGGPDHRGEY